MHVRQGKDSRSVGACVSGGGEAGVVGRSGKRVRPLSENSGKPCGAMLVCVLHCAAGAALQPLCRAGYLGRRVSMMSLPEGCMSMMR